jgi:virulence activator alpha
MDARHGGCRDVGGVEDDQFAAAGRELLAEWLTGPADHPTEIHDEGLLRLFFQRDGSSGAAQVQRLAAQRLRAHRCKLAEYEMILASAPAPDEPVPDPPGLGRTFQAPQAAALAYGLRFEQLAIAFRTQIAEHGADVVDPRVPLIETDDHR